MRRQTLILFGLLLLLKWTTSTSQAQSGPWTIKLVEADSNHLVLELTLSTYETIEVIHDGLLYQRISVPEWGSWGQPGQPQLPMYTTLLGMPAPGQPQVSIIEADQQTINEILIAPAPAFSLAGSSTAPQVIETFTAAPNAYQTSTSFPGSLVEVAESGWLRDQPVFQLRVYPFQYNPERQELQVYQRLKVQVTFPQGAPLAANSSRIADVPIFEEILQQSLLNYDALPRSNTALIDQSTDLATESEGATYLIITHPDFYDAVQSLASYRMSRGETVSIVKTQDIYNEFNGGVKSAQAIKSFLEEAYDTWSPKPVYVLLVGDASLNATGSSLPDLLPAYYVDTPLFGLAPNDAWYAKVNGDDPYPDLIVGRITARSANDVTTVLNKIQTYEQTPPAGSWQNRAILVADDVDANFKQDMNMVANFLPSDMTPVKLYDYNPNTSVASQINTGGVLLAYSGHGNTNVWGEWQETRRIFNQNQMQNLSNGNKLPFLTVANCLNGFFSDRNVARSMGEEFLLLNNKGGIASWSPSSYGFPTINGLMLEELYEAIFVDDDKILGSVVTTARINAYLRRPDLPLSLFEVFTYLGDPAVELIAPSAPSTFQLTGQDFPDPVVMGNLLTYTLTYTVSGSTATNLTLVSTLPQRVTYQSASLPPVINGQNLTWNLGNVSPGSGTVTTTVRVNTSGLTHGQSLTNQARLYDAASEQVVQIGTIVQDIPIAGLSANAQPNPTNLGEATLFSATTLSGTNVVYSWNLGDGSPTKTGATIQHTYPAIGTYVAQVTASNGVSSQNVTTTVTITDAPPSASFFSSTPDQLGQITTFQSTSSGTNLTYHWNFGDGNSKIGQSPLITHQYAAVATYTVVLTVSNSRGSDSTTGQVKIVQPGQVDPPVASFISSSPDELGQTTVFTSTSDDGGDVAENILYAWSFGDGSAVNTTLPTQTHTYTEPGIYQVSLTITNNVGSAIGSNPVVIGDEPIIGLSAVNNSPTLLGSVTTLSATTTAGTNIIYTWNFGDDSPLQTGPVVQHIYPTIGTYTASVTVTNGGLMSESQNTTVIIEDVPLGGLVLTSDSPTPLGSMTTLSATTTASTNIIYTWNFGDDSPLQVGPAIIQHTYPAAGTYTARVIATNGVSSQSQNTQVVIEAGPAPAGGTLFLPIVIKN